MKCRDSCKNVCFYIKVTIAQYNSKFNDGYPQRAGGNVKTIRNISTLYKITYLLYSVDDFLLK